MPIPNEAEYFQMIDRLKEAMDFASEELETLATAMDRPVLSKAVAAEIASRLRNLCFRVTFLVGNDATNPVPEGLPSIATTPTPDVHP